MPSRSAERPAAAEAVGRLEAWIRHDRAQRRVRACAPDVTVVDEAGGGSFEYRYDRRGDLVAAAGPGGARTTYSYDERRRLTAAERDGQTTTFAYDGERLSEIAGAGMRRFEYDELGRLTGIRDGSGATRLAYDERGRIAEARTAVVTTTHRFDDDDRLVAIAQVIDGVTIEARMDFDAAGRLAAIRAAGCEHPLRYTWDDVGRPLTVAFGEAVLARVTHDGERSRTTIERANGIADVIEVDPVDARPVRLSVRDGGHVRFERRYAFDEAVRLAGDGVRRFAYDELGRLARVTDAATGDDWAYAYDERDNRVRTCDADGDRRFAYDAADRLLDAAGGDGAVRFEHDASGRRTHRAGRRARTYRYDEAGHLRQVLDRGRRIADLTYDHKGRLVLARYRDRVERYLYGGDDELLAVTDEAGRPLRLEVRSTLGLLATVDPRSGDVQHLHLDHQGTCHLVTDAAGATVASPGYCPFGTPLSDDPSGARFGCREWHPDLELYRFDARWYDPETGRFLTPDTYTARPDDERLVHPLVPASGQAAARTAVMGSWLQRPRLANRYAYCANDPVNRLDPGGHWSFGGVLLTLLGVVWTLPNTMIGLLIEVLCLIGEVVRWLVWLFSGGNVSWETPGFDVAASSDLNAFALVFAGGWLGSFSSLQGITFGNVFFVYGPAKGQQWLYNHELRHTNQYGWLGPFFLPFYLFDAVIINDYASACTERDARAHEH